MPLRLLNDTGTLVLNVNSVVVLVFGFIFIINSLSLWKFHKNFHNPLAIVTRVRLDFQQSVRRVTQGSVFRIACIGPLSAFGAVLYGLRQLGRVSGR